MSLFPSNEAFLATTGGGGTGSFPVEIFTGFDKVLDVADNLKFHVMDNTGAMCVIIQENAVEAFPIGAEMEFLRESTGTVTFVTTGVAVLDSRDGLVTLNAQYSAGTLKKTGTDEWGLIGDLA